MANHGTQRCAFGCNKRRKLKTDAESVTSDGDGSSDEKSVTNSNSQEHFTRKLSFQFAYFRPV